MKKTFTRKIGLAIALTSVTIGLLGMVFVSYKTYAANLVAGPLTITYAGTQLFSEANIAPGSVIVKDLSVTNNGTLPHSFSISTSNVSGNLATVIQIEPRDGGAAIWNRTLSQLASLPNGTLEIIPAIAPGATKNIQIAAIFPASSGNDLQGQEVANFNFNMGTQSTDAAEPSQYTNSPNLSLGQRVRTAITYNPTAPNESDNSISTSATSGSTGAVAGASTEGEAKGAATTAATELCFWWIAALAILIITLVIYHRYTKKVGKSVAWWVWPIILSVALYFGQAYFDTIYKPTIFCHYFWAMELIVLIIYYWIDSRSEAVES